MLNTSHQEAKIQCAHASENTMYRLQQRKGPYYKRQLPHVNSLYHCFLEKENAHCPKDLCQNK